MDCAMEQNFKSKKVVHIESACRQIMHIVLLKRLVTIMVSSTTHPSNKVPAWSNSPLLIELNWSDELLNHAPAWDGNWLHRAK